MAEFTVPIIRIPFDDEDRDFMQSGIADVFGSGFLTQGKYTQEFEAQFSAFTGAKHSVAVNSGTAALEVILRALGVEGGSVIVPTNTFMATALAAIHAGNRVIFADSDPETLSLDVDDVARRIEPDTRAVMLVHIGGIITPRFQELQALCESRGLFLIEDCAHAHGSSIDGRSAGTLGVAGAFSFFPTKPLTTGEGGMVTTDDDGVAERARMIRNQGKDPNQGGHIGELGHNYRLSEVTAMIGVQQMHRAEEFLEDRRRIARFYDQALADFSGLRAQVVPPGTVSSYYKYVVFLDPAYERADVKRTMKEKYGVSLPGEVYADLCHDEPLWQRYTYCGRRRDAEPVFCPRWPGCGCDKAQSGFEGAVQGSKEHLCLPLYPGLGDEVLQYVMDSLDRTLHQDLASK